MMTKHTPTPWNLSQYTNYEGFSIASQDGECLAERWYDKARTAPQREVLKANAYFIVKAVNCHDELVKQLRDMYDFIIDHNYSDEESDGMKQAAAILASAGAA